MRKFFFFVYWFFRQSSQPIKYLSVITQIFAVESSFCMGFIFCINNSVPTSKHFPPVFSLFLYLSQIHNYIVYHTIPISPFSVSLTSFFPFLPSSLDLFPSLLTLPLKVYLPSLSLSKYFIINIELLILMVCYFFHLCLHLIYAHNLISHDCLLQWSYL